MNNQKILTSSGASFVPTLFMIFLTLKLCKVIDWPWIWVTSPLWIGFILFFCLCFAAIVVAFLFGLADNRYR